MCMCVCNCVCMLIEVFRDGAQIKAGVYVCYRVCLLLCVYARQGSRPDDQKLASLPVLHKVGVQDCQCCTLYTGHVS